MTKKRRNIIISLSILAIVLVVLVIRLLQLNAQAIAERDYPEIKQSGTIHIVTNYDPIEYYASSDTIAGYIHDILDGISQYTDIKFEVSVENKLDQCFDDLRKGKYDIIARNIAINSNLRNDYSFTNPVIHNKLVLVQRKAQYNQGQEPIRNHLQLALKTLYISENAPSKTRIRNLAHEIGDTIYIVEDKTYEPNQLAMMVASGDIDYTVCDIKTAKNIAAKIPELDISTDIGFTHLEGWAVRHNSPILLDSLNSWIERFKKTKEYSKILNKYYK